MKNQRQGQVVGYDALALEECPVLVANCSVCTEYVEHVTMTPVILS